MREDRYGSPWLTPREAAVYSRCSEERIRSAIACGEIAAHPRLGSTRGMLVSARGLDRLIESEVLRMPVAAVLMQKGA